MSLQAGRALVLAVEENTCALEVRADALQMEGVVLVRSYMEALGLIAAHKAGINPACLTPEITPIRDLEISMEDLEDPPAHGDLNGD